MNSGKAAIVVGSDHLFDDSLPMATVGGTRFLDLLLSRIRRRFPDTLKIFAMAYLNIQELSEALRDMVAAHGFEFFVADRDHTARLARVARFYGLDHLVDIDVLHPLTSLHCLEAMLARHVAAGNDLTVCHNLPRTLAPVVVSAQAVTTCKSFTVFGFARHYGLEPAAAPAGHYADCMLARPGFFKAGLFEAPIRWEGAGFDPFAEAFASLSLADKENIPRLRNCVYTMGCDDFGVDEVIDAVLIENMRRGWDKSDLFDTSYSVVDRDTMSTPEDFRKRTEGEVAWFVTADPQFLGGADPADLTVLELGCGHGRLLAVLAGQFREAHGTDASTERVMEARYRLRHSPNVHVTQNDGRSLSQYGEAAFDRVFAHGVLVHINSKSIIDSYVREMARVVRPGGRIKFDIYHGKDVFGIGPRHFIGARYTEEEITALFDACGLSLVHIDYALNQEYCRQARAGREISRLPLKQMLVTGEKKARA